MSNEEGRQDVIEHLVNYVTKKLPQDEAPLVKQFVRQYYLRVSPEDLSSRSILDLYGAVLSHWHYISQRQPGEAKIRVFNPQLEKNGWQSAHTIIEISFEDMPFLVDSINIALSRMNLNIHLIIHMGSLKIRRDPKGKILEIVETSAPEGDWETEAAIYVEIDKQSDPVMLDRIAQEIHHVLEDVNAVVKDWPAMQSHGSEVLKMLEEMGSLVPKEELEESIAFLRWAIDDHFTFLAYHEFKVTGLGDNIAFQLVPESALGMPEIKKATRELYHLSYFPDVAQKLILSKQLIMCGKSNIRSTVHRPAYIDFITIKIFDKTGELTSICRFMGLYTAAVYNSSPKQIPLLRRKVDTVLARAGFIPRSHDDRALLNILETLPRDDLFQASVNELLELATGILHLQERQRIRLFVRRDTFGSFISCLVFVPRDRFTSALSLKMQDVLFKGFDGLEVEMSTRFSESSLARINYVIRVDPQKEYTFDIEFLEQKLVSVARTWHDDLNDALREHCGEERANELLRRYRYAFPAGYREVFPARIAVIDIDYFEQLSDENSLMMSLYQPLEDAEEIIRFKLFRRGATIPLSDVVPILENMGLRIISERPYEITPKDGTQSIWINDYRMVHKKGTILNTESIQITFQEAFDRIWRGLAENDGFNHLVLDARLTWREVMVLRAYAKYLWQAGFAFSQDHVEETLVANSTISEDLIQLFKMRFDPEHGASVADQMIQKEKIEKALESVSNLNEDRILRRYMETIFASIRTNYYQKNKEGDDKPYFSFKIESAKVPELPEPVPLYEIFVYSTHVEAVHLREAKVARGGIRWSDRREDFRTETLGLMKTQQVKNAVIVPMGAKGGFVVKKQLPSNATNEEIMAEVICCYKTFMRGLLDLTDNYQGSEIIHPPLVIRYDDDDPYLVVAADKGTATFSDIANGIAKEYNFWLRDAFASGGSTGYDHKKMGITARGAWESVKGHFQELAFDIQKDDFTVFGIGDMSGDVFGNGMLLSHHIKLIAAFNHIHIFLDPNPDAEKGFIERQRLFNLPRSSWADYNPDCISKGGGVYLRSAKSITLSPEAQKALDFYQDKVIPSELIRAILKSPVDLFWNGGIGTYVKATREPNIAVGDRANDAVRINGAELRCRVVAEGGNLGLTQLGRIEYAKLGGQLNTDAIDNSGGVNCSDNEVNLKILLNRVVDLGDLTEKQRNEILAKLQEDVAKLVLGNNSWQTKAISVAVFQAVDNLEMHGRLIQEMERTGRLDRALEYLPDPEEIATRKNAQLGLTRPEIAVLMAYSKTLLKESLLESNLPEEPYFQSELVRAFPKLIQDQFKQYLEQHSLKREIITTQLSNEVVNEMGMSFVSRLQDETGAQPADIIRAYTVSREIFKAQDLHDEIDGLGTTVEITEQYKMVQEVHRLVRRGARWFLRNRRSGMDIVETIKSFTLTVQQVSELLPTILVNSESEREELAENWIKATVPKELAYKIGSMSAMFSALDIVEAASLNKFKVEDVAVIYYSLGHRLQLGWFRELIKKHKISNHWEALARAAFRDDLDRQQRNLTIVIMHHNDASLDDPDALITKWFKKHQTLVSRWDYFITELKNTPDAGFTMFAVALRELLEMAQSNSRKEAS